MADIEFPVSAESDGRFVRDIIRNDLNISSGLLTKLKKNGGIRLNGKNVTVAQKVCAGDLLTILFPTEKSETIQSVNIPLDIIYEDEDLLVINKPADMPIHPSLNNYENSLANALAWYFAKQDKPFVFRCINRLDRDTSGLTIVAKHMLSGGILSSMVAKRAIHREYLAIVRGHITPENGTIDAPIGRKGDSIIERQIDYAHGERAVTHYTLKEYKNGHSLLSIHLETGRTHQIRVHMKHIGFPLIGDYLYNPDMEYMTRQALHSHRLQFTHPITGESMDFTAPLPVDMQRVLEP